MQEVNELAKVYCTPNKKKGGSLIRRILTHILKKLEEKEKITLTPEQIFKANYGDRIDV